MQQHDNLEDFDPQAFNEFYELYDNGDGWEKKDLKRILLKYVAS